MKKRGKYQGNVFSDKLSKEGKPEQIMPRHQALFLILSDQVISQWLKTMFSPPEKSPLVSINLELVPKDGQTLWRAEIKEKGRHNSLSLSVILAWIDACSGQIIDRKFYAWLKKEEFDELVNG